MQIEYFWMCVCLTLLIIFMWGKIKNHFKETEKLKGYQPFNKKETD